MNDKVVRLVDRGKYAVDGHDGLIAWAQAWLDSFNAGEFGKFRSMVMLVESADGTLAAVSQSLGALDKARLSGLLFNAAHCCADGCLDIERLEVASAND